MVAMQSTSISISGGSPAWTVVRAGKGADLRMGLLVSSMDCVVGATYGGL
jgi:hypothetical protein